MIGKWWIACLWPGRLESWEHALWTRHNVDVVREQSMSRVSRYSGWVDRFEDDSSTRPRAESSAEMAGSRKCRKF